MALAVPAMPGLMKLVQPDGSVVEATIKGDEHLHYYETAAGEILLRDDAGTLRPAVIADNGELQARALPHRSRYAGPSWMLWADRQPPLPGRNVWLPT